LRYHIIKQKDGSWTWGDNEPLLDCTKQDIIYTNESGEEEMARGSQALASDRIFILKSRTKEVEWSEQPDKSDLQTKIIRGYYCGATDSNFIQKGKTVWPKCLKIDDNTLWYDYAIENIGGKDIEYILTLNPVGNKKVFGGIRNCQAEPTPGRAGFCYNGACFYKECASTQAHRDDYRDALATLGGTPPDITGAVVDESTIQEKLSAYEKVMDYIVACDNCANEFNYGICKQEPVRAWEMCIENCDVITECFGPFWARECTTHPDPECVQSCELGEAKCHGGTIAGMLFSSMSVCKLVPHEIEEAPTLADPDFTWLRFSKPQVAEDFEDEYEEYARAQSEEAMRQQEEWEEQYGERGGEEEEHMSGEGYDGEIGPLYPIPEFPSCHGMLVPDCGDGTSEIACNNRYMEFEGPTGYYQCGYIKGVGKCVLDQPCQLA